MWRHLFGNSSAFTEVVKKKRESAERLQSRREGHLLRDTKRNKFIHKYFFVALFSGILMLKPFLGLLSF